ncbi:hypothetical protein [Phocaeicola plebeius]|uniref:hypothetical protein n=1 Tax=Phocaeicola plebeius TaxID=310297 RepID=UPI0026EBD612|nr:hypothetical protein [Phocaeicola plebeius]
MEEEVKMLFQLAYYPVMYANQRLNGGDFLSVAIPLMDALREQIDDEAKLKKAARIMVLEFNSMLNPQMDVHQINDLINTIYKPGAMTRALAKQIADEFTRRHH